MIDLRCRYCKSEMKLHGSRDNNVFIFHMYWCKYCQSEQTIDDSGTLREWSFMVGENYCIHYWPQSKAFKIIEYKDGRPSKYVLEITLKESPDHMTPSSMTEERVRCLVVFS